MKILKAEKAYKHIKEAKEICEKLGLRLTVGIDYWCENWRVSYRSKDEKYSKRSFSGTTSESLHCFVNGLYLARKWFEEKRKFQCNKCEAVGNHNVAKGSKFATAGDFGTAITKEYGNSIAGSGGLAMAGRNGYATAGEDGRIEIEYWDRDRVRVKIGYIGEDGLKPNVAYKLDENNEFVEVEG